MIKLNNNHTIKWSIEKAIDSGEPYIKFVKYFKYEPFKESSNLSDLLKFERLYIDKDNDDIILIDKDEKCDINGELRLYYNKLICDKLGTDLDIVLHEGFNNDFFISYDVYSESELVKSFDSFKTAFDFAFL